MGEKHVKTCVEDRTDIDVLGCTVGRRRMEYMMTKWGIPVVLDYRELVGKVDGVIVAVPNELHSEVAGWFCVIASLYWWKSPSQIH